MADRFLQETMNTELTLWQERARLWLVTPPAENAGEAIEALLFSLPHLASGGWTTLFCEVLLFYRHWDGALAKPQRWKIRLALGETLPVLPPDDLAPLWTLLQGESLFSRRAMQVGVELLATQYAVAHLVAGLEFCHKHNARAFIADQLEMMGDASALPSLYRVYRECAKTDWTLARHIARVIGIIETRIASDVSLSSKTRQLLRPSAMPPHNFPDLLRSVDAATMLVRPAEPVGSELWEFQENSPLEPPRE